MYDLIERRAALTALCEDCLRKYDGICPHPASRCVEFRTIKQLPAIDAEPVKHGRWIEDHTDLICSVCKWKYSDELPFMSNHGLDSMTEAFAHCPHCGAKMYQTGGTISKERIAEILGADND